VIGILVLVVEMLVYSLMMVAVNPDGSSLAGGGVKLVMVI
jgi:hypothetical protein